MWKNICPENTLEDAHETNTRRPETKVQQRLEGSQGYVWNLRQKFRNNFKSKSKFILFYGINDNVTKRRFENELLRVIQQAEHCLLLFPYPQSV